MLACFDPVVCYLLRTGQLEVDRARVSWHEAPYGLPRLDLGYGAGEDFGEAPAGSDAIRIIVVFQFRQDAERNGIGIPPVEDSSGAAIGKVAGALEAEEAGLDAD